MLRHSTQAQRKLLLIVVLARAPLDQRVLSRGHLVAPRRKPHSRAESASKRSNSVSSVQRRWSGFNGAEPSRLGKPSGVTPSQHGSTTTGADEGRSARTSLATPPALNGTARSTPRSDSHQASRLRSAFDDHQSLRCRLHSAPLASLIVGRGLRPGLPSQSCFHNGSEVLGCSP